MTQCKAPTISSCTQGGPEIPIKAIAEMDHLSKNKEILGKNRKVWFNLTTRILQKETLMTAVIKDVLAELQAEEITVNRRGG